MNTDAKNEKLIRCNPCYPRLIFCFLFVGQRVDRVFLRGLDRGIERAQQ